MANLCSSWKVAVDFTSNKLLMEDKIKPHQSSSRHLNDYEKSKMLRVQENQKKLQALGLTNIAKSVTSLVESDKTKKRKKIPMDTNEKDVEYMPDFDVEGEQDYEEQDATTVRVTKKAPRPQYIEQDATSVRVTKKPPRPQYIAPMSMKRHANLAKQRVIAPNVSHVLPSTESRMLNRELINTSRAIKSRVLESQEGHKRNGQLVDTIPAKENQSRERVTMGEFILNKRGSLKQTEKLKQNLENSKSITTRKSSVARRNLSVIDNNDEDREGDMICHGMTEEQDGAENDNVENMEQTIIESNENDGIEDMDVNADYEEQDGSEDDGDEDMNNSENDVENENDELVHEEHEVPQLENEAVENVRKRVRGPTRMPKIWAQERGKRIPIIVNELGQHINAESSQLTHFMGTLSRSGKYCPVHKPWNKVDDTKKQFLLEFIKTKFDIPEEAETWILQSFGRKVKNWRARVKEHYHDPSLSLQEQISSRPKQVQKKQWRRLVKFWNKEKSKRVSEKNKANRAKKKMVQVTGKKSYARVREELKTSLGQEPSRLEMFRECFSKDGNTKNVEAANAIQQMQELSSQLPEGSIDKPGPNDVFSKVMGKDRNGNGDADMYGLGVRASDVWGVIPSHSACRRENIQLNSRCEELSHKVAQLTAEKNGSTNGSSVPTSTSQRLTVVSNGPQFLRVGDEVFLKSILNSSEKVARGRVKSLDPNEQVGGKEIGREWCEVNVQVAIKRDEDLVRPYGLFVTIADAIGASIAWHCPFISVVREE